MLEKSELRVVEGQLSRALGRCIADFELIAPGDRVMVCMSGGKDSYTLLSLLQGFQRRAPFAFELLAVHLDQGQPGYDGTKLRAHLAQSGVPFRILREDTYSVVIDKVEPGKTYCSLCSRLRRGVLYNAAQALGCTKLALGHHRDDAIETLMLNMLYAGALAAMPPKLQSRDGRNVVIRPLLYAHESVIARYAELMAFPILPCDLCGSQEQLKRKQIKKLLAELEVLAPGVRESMLGAMGNVKAAHLLDRTLWRKLALQADVDEGDTGEVGGASARPFVDVDARGAVDTRAREPIPPAAAHASPRPVGLGGTRRLPLLR